MHSQVKEARVTVFHAQLVNIVQVLKTLKQLDHAKQVTTV